MEPKKTDQCNDIYSQVGNNIRFYRLKNHLTQDELASLIGLTRVSITNIEKGVGGLSLHRLIDLSKLFSISLCELVEGQKLSDQLPQKLNKQGCHNCTHNRGDSCDKVEGIKPEDNFFCKKYKRKMG